jgi:hypothetical protein
MKSGRATCKDGPSYDVAFDDHVYWHMKKRCYGLDLWKYLPKTV